MMFFKSTNENWSRLEGEGKGQTAVGLKLSSASLTSISEHKHRLNTWRVRESFISLSSVVLVKNLSRFKLDADVREMRLHKRGIGRLLSSAVSALWPFHCGSVSNTVEYEGTL